MAKIFQRHKCSGKYMTFKEGAATSDVNGLSLLEFTMEAQRSLLHLLSVQKISAESTKKTAFGSGWKQASVPVLHSDIYWEEEKWDSDGMFPSHHTELLSRNTDKKFII